MKYRPGTVALREIRKYQRTTDLQFPKIAFQRLVKEIVQTMFIESKIPYCPKFQSTAIQALQEASEQFLTGVFNDSQMAAIHAGRITVTPKDVQLVKYYKGW